jgi:AGZA family xanthine/uracil permease-like MFS transporter
MFGLATLGGIMKEDGEIPGSMWAFIASGAGTLLAAWTGSTPIIVCVETASGVREGGRTGLTAVVIGLYFAASLFLAPLFSSVPDMATAPVLVMVGVMMVGESAKINWERMNDALPLFFDNYPHATDLSLPTAIFRLLRRGGLLFHHGTVLDGCQDDAP